MSTSLHKSSKFSKANSKGFEQQIIQPPKNMFAFLVYNFFTSIVFV